MNIKIEAIRLQRIFGLAMPIVAGMLSQNILNLVDTAMVGRLGPEALAAVGISSMVAFMFLAPVLGVASGVQAISSRKKGEGKVTETAFSLNNAFVYSFVFSILVLVLGFYFAKPLFAMITETESVGTLAREYFLIRISVCFFAIMNFAFRGYWNSVDLSKVYMNTLIVMHITNIALNYLLIFGKFGFPRMDSNGAALATAISIVVGFLIYFFQAVRLASENGFLKKFPSYKYLRMLTNISLPAGFELTITMTNVVALYWLVGKVGTVELASLNIIMNIFMVALLPALGLGITLATLSGQALGAKNKEDAYAWGREITQIGTVLLTLLALPLFFVPHQVLALFTNSVEVIETGESALRIMGITLGLEMIGYLLVEGLKGLGYSKKVSIISFIWQWLIFLPGAALLVLVFKQGLFMIWIWQIIMHLIQSVIFIYIWKRKKWQEQKFTH
jgi:multidrug resistance protein, MATE family